MVENQQLPISYEFGNYSFLDMIWSPSEHKDCQGGKARLPHHLLRTCVWSQRWRPHSLQLACFKHEYILGKLKQMVQKNPLEHQRGQGSPCPQELPTNKERMKLEN